MVSAASEFTDACLALTSALKRLFVVRLIAISVSLDLTCPWLGNSYRTGKGFTCFGLAF